MICRIGFGVFVALVMWADASPQDHQPRNDPASAISLELVRNGLYVATGAGGNTAVRFSGSGIILVDGKLPGHYRELVSQLGRIAELPIRMLILTSQDESHTGTNAEFLMHGIPVVGPSAVFEEERAVRLGGVTVNLQHLGPARTGADAIVYFPDLKVVAVGDLFTREIPQVDFDAGGSMAGWAAALEQILRLDFDKVIPGSGPVVDRAELQRFKSQLDARK